MTDEGLARGIPELRSVLLDVLRPLVAGRRVALLDFPNYSNCGDSAIWAGQLAALEALGCGVEVVAGSAEDMDRVRTLRSGTVLMLSGGGNFGDLYPRHQRFREAVAAAMPGHRIVQLPQSIHFSSPEAAADSFTRLERHGDFHLLVRDESSAALAESLSGRRPSLCPDAALMLELSRRASPECEVFVLARSDAEARVSLSAAARDVDLPVADWYDAGQAGSRTGVGAARRILSHRGRPINVLLDSRRSRLRAALCRWTATREVERGLDAISRGRVLLTDRLHAHILAELADIPHVVVDTGYGKIRRFHERWLQEHSSAVFADSPAEGCRSAVELAART